MVGRLKELPPTMSGVFILYQEFPVFLTAQITNMKTYLFLLLLITGISCQPASSQSVSVEEFATGIQKENIQLLDVRTAGEHKKGHIENSLHADWLDRKEFNRRTEFLDKSRPVYVYCASGPRSTAASKWLRSHGYKEVIELKGGFNAWKANDKPFEAITAGKSISNEEYQTLINSKNAILVDFGAPWCPPCKKMEPVLAELERSMPAGSSLIRIDADEATQLMKELKVESLPTFIVYKQGKESWRKEGIATLSELKSKLN